MVPVRRMYPSEEPDHHRMQERLRKYRAWFVYEAANHMDDSFTLTDLATKIKALCGVKPHVASIRKCVADQNRGGGHHVLHWLPQARAGSQLCVIDREYSLSGNPFQSPRTRRGRPRIHEGNRREYQRHYQRHYHYMRRHFHEYLLRLFEELPAESTLSAEEIARYMRTCMGVRLRTHVILGEIRNYNSAYAPPYIRDVKADEFQLRREDT